MPVSASPKDTSKETLAQQVAGLAALTPVQRAMPAATAAARKALGRAIAGASPQARQRFERLLAVAGLSGVRADQVPQTPWPAFDPALPGGAPRLAELLPVPDRQRLGRTAARSFATEAPAGTVLNQEVAVLAKQIYELSVLTPEQLDARKVEALLLINAAYGSATPEGLDRARADKEARWGAAIRAEGLLAALHPKWHVRTDDGRPPVVQRALESALHNPSRDLRTRLQALQFIPEGSRASLVDVVRAFEDQCWRGAKGDARDAFLKEMRTISPTWFEDPWLTVLAQDGRPPPVSILIENQGETHDGGWYDDPTDDTAWEKIKFGWAEAIRTWDVTFLRDNPVSQLYLDVTAAAGSAVDTAGEVLAGSNDAVKSAARLLRWAPYAVAGIGVLGLGALVLHPRPASPAVPEETTP